MGRRDLLLLLLWILVVSLRGESASAAGITQQLKRLEQWIHQQESQSPPRITVHRPADLQFLHIPKTGGEYVEQLFQLRKSHDMMSELYARKLAHKFVFTVLRDPLSRAVSWYNFCRSGYHGVVSALPRPLTECQQARELELNAFLLLIFVTTSYTQVQHIMRNTYDDYLCLNNTPVFHYALHFESLEEDMQYLLSSLGQPSFINSTLQEQEVNESTHLKSVADVHPMVEQLFREARHSDYVMYEHNHRFRVSPRCISLPKHPLAFQYERSGKRGRVEAIPL